jgi:hypothetical protein
MHTPATLAKLVMGLATRVQLQLGDTPTAQGAAAAAAAGKGGVSESSTNSSSSSDRSTELLQQLPQHWQLQPHFQLAWRASWQWMLHMPAAAAAAADNGTGNLLHSSSSSVQEGSAQQVQRSGSAATPFAYTGSMEPIGELDNPTPLLRVVLLTDAAVARLLRDKSISRTVHHLQRALRKPAMAAAGKVGAYTVVHDALIAGKDVGPGVAVIDSVTVVADAQAPDTRPMQVSKHLTD